MDERTVRSRTTSAADRCPVGLKVLQERTSCWDTRAKYDGSLTLHFENGMVVK
jgi:hypothetical protein